MHLVMTPYTAGITVPIMPTAITKVITIMRIIVDTTATAIMMM